jgi:hypothetical protein
MAIKAEHRRRETPGVYRLDTFSFPSRTEFRTGVPAFLGVPAAMPMGKDGKPHGHPWMLSLWPHYSLYFGGSEGGTGGGFLGYAVRGFFQNGGQICYVVPMQENTRAELERALDAIVTLDGIDLVCAPDLAAIQTDSLYDLQQIVMAHCETAGNRFAILDPKAGEPVETAGQQWSAINGINGAIYYPWLQVPGPGGALKTVPPCGHVAGVYARSDRDVGVHKAPANEALEGVAGLERIIGDADQARLNPAGINCIRSFPGRGIRVWGARTLSAHSVWTYVNVRRVFLTAVRWVQWNMRSVVFEPNNPTLWARIERELSTYFVDQFRRGALKGRTPQEAFYVKCDAETNLPEFYERGEVVTEIGLAPSIPFEFVVIRMIHGASGVTINGPERSKTDLKGES